MRGILKAGNPMIKKAFSLKKRLFQIFILLIVIGTGAWWLWNQYRPVHVRIVQPERGLAVEAVYATGLVEAQKTAKVGPVTGGQIVEILAETGDTVQKGQILAVMNDRQARQRLQEVEAVYNLALQENQRVQSLLAKGIATPQMADRARADLQQAQANLQLQRTILADLNITAPMNGLISSRDIFLGQNVTSNSVLFTVVSGDMKRIIADIDERDVNKLALNSRLLAKAEGFPKQVFEANISKIYQTANTTNRTYRIEANLPENTPLLIGMTLDINVILAERSNAILLPSQAIHFEQTAINQAPNIYVWHVSNGQAVRMPIEIGVQGLEKTEVITALDPQTQIIISPIDELRPNRSVYIIP